MIPDKDTLQLYVDKRLITCQKHPEEELWIYNYAALAQYERIWDEVTTVCRGLIVDSDHNIIARPFPKFFNLEEHSSSDIVFSKNYRIFEKVDGSLGIFYKRPSNDRWAVATRGSFTSDQAIKATQIFYDKYATGWSPAEGYTTLVEIIYPENRIVVNYGDAEDLVLITTINNITGRDVPEPFWVGPRVKSWSLNSSVKRVKPKEVLGQLGLTDDGDTEGIVMVFDWPKEGPQTRVKIKLDEYKRLHRILTGVSTKTIWECLRNNEPMNDILERIPDEFYDWVTNTVTDLTQQYKSQEAKILELYALTLSKLCPEGFLDLEKRDYALRNRKDFAILAKETKYANYMFALLDQKHIYTMIWDSIRPEYSKAFARDKDS